MPTSLCAYAEGVAVFQRLTIRSLVIWVTIFGWVLNLVAPLVIKTYEPVDGVNAIFMLVVGAVMATGGKNKDEDDDDHHGDRKEMQDD